MERWELEARESIRDLVARYNSNGDAGRFEPLLELFATNAVMEIVGGADSRVYRGRDEIAQIFTGARDRYASSAAPATSPHASARPTGPFHLRHFTATQQIDLVDETHATGRCYYQVLMPHGLDHWGRYIDEYEKVDGRWRFMSRRVTVDGRSETSIG